jgi:hypothetical protein
MEDIVEFKLKKNEKSRLILFVVFKKTSFTISDEKISKQVIDKYGKIISKYKDLYIVIDSRCVSNMSAELAWNIVSEFIKLNDIAIKNVKKVSVIISSKELFRLIEVMQKVYSFVVPTKICNTNQQALEYVEN